MDRRTQADRDSGGKTPTGQTSRGYPKTEARNPKNNSSRRPDVDGMVPDAGGAINQQTTRIQSPSGYPGRNAPNRFGKGADRTEPDGSSINRGYTQVTGANVPQVTKVTSANRQNFNIDPGTPPQPDGDTTDTPARPRFGVGGTGD